MESTGSAVDGSALGCGRGEQVEEGGLGDHDAAAEADDGQLAPGDELVGEGPGDPEELAGLGHTEDEAVTSLVVWPCIPRRRLSKGAEPSEPRRGRRRSSDSEEAPVRRDSGVVVVVMAEGCARDVHVDVHADVRTQEIRRRTVRFPTASPPERPGQRRVDAPLWTLAWTSGEKILFGADRGGQGRRSRGAHVWAPCLEGPGALPRWTQWIRPDRQGRPGCASPPVRGRSAPQNESGRSTGCLAWPHATVCIEFGTLAERSWLCPEGSHSCSEVRVFEVRVDPAITGRSSFRNGR